MGIITSHFKKTIKPRPVLWFFVLVLDFLIFFVLSAFMIEVEDNYDWDIGLYMDSVGFPLNSIPVLFLLWFIINGIMILYIGVRLLFMIWFAPRLDK